MLITGTTLFKNDIITSPALTLEQAIEGLKLNNNQITDESILSNKIVIYKALEGEAHLCYKNRSFTFFNGTLSLLYFCYQWRYS